MGRGRGRRGVARGPAHVRQLDAEPGPPRGVEPEVGAEPPAPEPERPVDEALWARRARWELERRKFEEHRAQESAPGEGTGGSPE